MLKSHLHSPESSNRGDVLLAQLQVQVLPVNIEGKLLACLEGRTDLDHGQ